MTEFDLGQVAFVYSVGYSPTETYMKWDFVRSAESTYL